MEINAFAIRIQWRRLERHIKLIKNRLIEKFEFPSKFVSIAPIRNQGGGLPLLDNGKGSSSIFTSIELALFLREDHMYMVQKATRYTYNGYMSEQEAFMLHLADIDVCYVEIPLDQLANRLPKKALTLLLTYSIKKGTYGTTTVFQPDPAVLYTGHWQLWIRGLC